MNYLFTCNTCWSFLFNPFSSSGAKAYLQREFNEKIPVTATKPVVNALPFTRFTRDRQFFWNIFFVVFQFL